MEPSSSSTLAPWSRTALCTDNQWPLNKTGSPSHFLDTAGASDRCIGRSNRTSWKTAPSDTDDTLVFSNEDATTSQQRLHLKDYNALAEKNGLAPIHFPQMTEEEDEYSASREGQPRDRRSWFTRTFGKPSMPAPRRSSRHSTSSRTDKNSNHQRSDSDPTNQPLTSFHAKSDTVDTLKNQTLQTLVRICGKSFLYLPGEYATRSLMLPTCLRAAAQYLVQNGPETRGIFRISGSMKVVNELYDYYCVDFDSDEDISTTVRSPNLPFHIKAGVYDVASMFKRLLSSLPGGILGYSSLFEALVEIKKMEHSSRTERCQTRAQLVALAIGSVPSLLQRELICAVFGLLSLIGRAAETAAASPNKTGSSTPNSERMGYAALGIIFGPLLVGDLLDSYLPESQSNILSLPGTPPRTKPDRRRKHNALDKNPLASLPSTLDKILLANDITEMVITNWGDVIKHMKQIGIMRKSSMLQHTENTYQKPPSIMLRPCRSDTFTNPNIAVVAQHTPQRHDSQLRKSRSVSNYRSRSNAIGAVTHELGSKSSQRPTDMTFEEFTARKKLRNHASSISISSDSTYSAIEPQPVKPLSPALEDPFYIASRNASRPTTTKLTKQRRTSSGISSIFGDRSFSPIKGSPKVSRKPEHDGEESQYRNKKFSAPTWNMSSGAAKVKETTCHDVGDNKPTGFQTKSTPGWKHRSNDTGCPCKYDTTGDLLEQVPRSKTAALVSKIINTKQQSVPARTKRFDTEVYVHSHEGQPHRMVENPGFCTSVNPPLTRQQNFHNGLTPKSGMNWPLSHVGHTPTEPDSPSNPDSQSLQRAGQITPTSKRQGMGQGSFGIHSGLPSTRSRTKSSNKSPTLSARYFPGNPTAKRPISKYNNKDVTPTTPQKHLYNNVTSPKEAGSFSGTGKKSVLSTKTAGHEDLLGSQDSSPPLSEIKNDAGALARTSSKCSTKTTHSTSLLAPTEGDAHRMEVKSPAVGSSVKAMAAMFDNAAGNTPPAEAVSQSKAIRPLQRTERSSGLSPYKNAPAPPKPPGWRDEVDAVDSRLQGVGGTDWRKPQTSHIGLSKSEDRSLALRKTGRPDVSDRKEKTLSMNGKDNTNLIFKRPIVVEKQIGVSNPASQIGQRRDCNNDRAFHTKDSTSPSPIGSRRNTKAATSSPSLAFHNTRHRPLERGKGGALSCSSESISSTEELKRLLQVRDVECQRWKLRAEAAEKRVSELELILGSKDGCDAARSDSGSRNGKMTIDPLVAMLDQINRTPWSEEDVLSTPPSMHVLEERTTLRKAATEEENRYVVMPIRRGIGKQDENTPDTDTSRDVHGRLANKQLFDMMHGH